MILSKICIAHFLESPVIIPQVVHIKGFKHDAVKILLDWLRGYKILLDSCSNIEILSDMLLLADFYDIQRPVSAITQKIDSVAIKDDNLIIVMECVAKLEKVDSFKGKANSLETKCAQFFEKQYRSAKAVGSFVNNNFVNINLVNRLLVKSTNLNTATGESKRKRVTSQEPCPGCKKVFIPIRPAPRF